MIDKLFFKCVDLLTNLAEKLHISYETINVLIFCIIWPLITLISFIFNIYAYIKRI